MTKLADVLKEESYKVAGKPVTLNKGKKPDGTDADDHGTIVAVGIPSIPVRFAPEKSYLVAS